MDLPVDELVLSCSTEKAAQQCARAVWGGTDVQIATMAQVQQEDTSNP